MALVGLRVVSARYTPLFSQLGSQMPNGTWQIEAGENVGKRQLIKFVATSSVYLEPGHRFSVLCKPGRLSRTRFRAVELHNHDLDARWSVDSGLYCWLPKQ